MHTVTITTREKNGYKRNFIKADTLNEALKICRDAKLAGKGSKITSKKY